MYFLILSSFKVTRGLSNFVLRGGGMSEWWDYASDELEILDAEHKCPSEMVL